MENTIGIMLETNVGVQSAILHVCLSMALEEKERCLDIDQETLRPRAVALMKHIGSVALWPRGIMAPWHCGLYPLYTPKMTNIIRIVVGWLLNVPATC